MKKIVLVLLALAILSFAADEKKEDCSKYAKAGDTYYDLKKRTSEDAALTAIMTMATASYLRYQVCKDLQKEGK